MAAVVEAVPDARVVATASPTPTEAPTEITTASPKPTAAATAAVAGAPPPSPTPTAARTPAPTRTASPTPTQTVTPTPTPTATATATPTPTATPTASPNTPPSLLITSATTNQSLDVTIEFTLEDAEGGPIDIVVEYGDGSSESLTGANGEYTATHDYDRVGNYEVRVTATDDQGIPVADTAMVATSANIGVALASARLESLNACDTISSAENEFFGTVVAFGVSRSYAVGIPPGDTENLGVVSAAVIRL